MKKVAVIIGSGGQDGTLLTLKLKSLNYEVIGVKRGDIDLLNIEEVTRIVSTEMESATKLKVPLFVNIKNNKDLANN